MKKFLIRFLDNYNDGINIAMPHIVVSGVLYHFGLSWFVWIICLVSLYKAIKK